VIEDHRQWVFVVHENKIVEKKHLMWGVAQVLRNQMDYRAACLPRKLASEVIAFTNSANRKNVLTRNANQTTLDAQQEIQQRFIVRNAARRSYEIRVGQLMGLSGSAGVLLFSSPGVLGQAVNATLLGTVTDASGAVVAGRR